MVFVHGGSFVTGSGFDFNFTSLARATRSLCVSINYRLGALGWLMAGPGTSNLGLLDQLAALRWVREHVGAFGGDASRMLLYGESAGGVSVMAHVASPEQANSPLFSAALAESGVPAALPEAAAVRQARAFYAAAGCEAAGRTGAVASTRVNISSPLACLRGLPLASLLAAERRVAPGELDPLIGAGWGPTVDRTTALMPQDPLLTLREGRGARVPVALGSNTDEGSLFVLSAVPWPLPVSRRQYEALAREALDSMGVNRSAFFAEVMRLYPPRSHLPWSLSSQRPVASTLLGDYSFICGTRYVARLLSARAGASSRAQWLYHFDYASPSDPIASAMGVYHGSELRFVLGDTRGMNASEAVLAARIMGMWARLAASGRPTPQTATPHPPTPHPATPTGAVASSAASPVASAAASGGDGVWTPYSNTSDLALHLTVHADGSRLRMRPFPRAPRYCDFWERVAVQSPHPSLAIARALAALRAGESQTKSLAQHALA